MSNTLTITKTSPPTLNIAEIAATSVEVTTPGPAGARGIQGLTGIQGSTGAQGIQGETGSQGTQGNQGLTGAQGTIGAQGITGSQGADGIQGITGNTGNTVIVSDVYTSSANQTDFILSSGVQGEDYISVTRNGIVQVPNTDYSLSGNTVTLTDPSDLNDIIEVRQFVDISIAYGLQGVQGTTGIQGTYGTQGTTGNTGAQGIQGIQGLTGTQGAVGTQGIQGTTGDTGSQGTTGSQGAIGSQGTQGTTGDTGSQGIQGIQGETGIQGTAGVLGADGAQGIQGIQGLTGVQGLQGVIGEMVSSLRWGLETGTSVVDPGNGQSRLNNTTHASATILCISEYDSGISLREDYLNAIKIGDLIRIQSLTNPNQFNIYKITSKIDQLSWFQFGITLVSGTGNLSLDTQMLYAFSSSGIQGFTGSQGATGTQGTTGAQGIQGTTGSQGTTGIQGAVGTQGVTGAQGIQGVTGSQGATGTQGAVGAQGATGAQGIQGTTGIQGIQGITGDTGAQGIQGIQGLTGTQGVQGLQGLQGIQGLTSATTITNDEFTATAGQTNFTLSATVSSELFVIVTRNGVTLTPITHYTLSGSTLILSDPADLNDIIEVRQFSTLDLAAGPQGITGAQGIQGIQGLQGLTSNIASVHVANVAPTGYDGLLWWNKDDGTLRLYYEDVDSGQWVVTTPTLVGPAGPAANIGGSNNNIQYNSNGELAGSNTWQFVPSSNTVTLNGNLAISNASSRGIKIDTANPDWGWRDIIGKVTPKASGGGSPAREIYSAAGNIGQYAFVVNDICDFEFHIPHDYVPNSNIYFHIHWSHTGTDVSGTMAWSVYHSYAKGHQQMAFSAEKNINISYNTVNIATTPQRRHMITEIQLSYPGGTANTIDTANVEVDGLVLMSAKLTSIPTITGGKLFLHTADIHYKSTNLATKGKAPNFYTGV